MYNYILLWIVNFVNTSESNNTFCGTIFNATKITIKKILKQSLTIWKHFFKK